MKCPQCGNEMMSARKDYRYVEAGLKNVILKNIVVHECKRCRDVLPEIPNIENLHRVLGLMLVKKDSPLTGEEFRFLRKNMGMSAQDLAENFGVSPVTVSRWENNREKIGAPSDRLIRWMYVTKLARYLKPARLIMQNKYFGKLTATMASIADKSPKPVHVEVNKKEWEVQELSL